MITAADPGRDSGRRLRLGAQLIGPLYAAIAGLVWVLLSTLAGIGPLDRAQSTALIALPILLTSPLVTAATARRSSERIPRGLWLSSLVVFLLAFIVLGLSGNTVACRSVTTAEVLSRASVIGLIGGLGHGIASALVLRALNRQRYFVAWVTGATTIVLTGGVAIAAYLVLWPVLSCAAPS